MKSKVVQNITISPGLNGLPKDYPTPEKTDRLQFYIQRNQNKNTVVYNLNINCDGCVNQEYPMEVSWINYSDGGEKMDLNYFQNKLAYGYRSKLINSSTFEFHFHSYEKLRFFIAKQPDGHYKTLLNISGEMSILHNVYVYAEEFGVFPQVKFIELFGKSLASDNSTYQRILI